MNKYQLLGAAVAALHGYLLDSRYDEIKHFIPIFIYKIDNYKVKIFLNYFSSNYLLSRKPLSHKYVIQN